MDYYFNELSLAPVADRPSAQSMMEEFVKICSTLESFGLASLRVTDANTLTTFELCQGYYVYDWLKDRDRNVDRTLQSQFRSLATRYPLIRASDIVLSKVFTLSEFQIQESSDDIPKAQGLGLAFLSQSIALSFLSSAFWDKAEIGLNHLSLSEVGWEASAVTANHAARVDHIHEHLPWLNRLGTARDPRNFFPRRSFAESLVAKKYGGWSEYRKFCLLLSATERIASYEDIGARVAERHGYSKNERVSSLNNRLIFSADEGSNCIYLSLDRKTGAFEVCNHKGRHLGEYNFEGVQIDPPDDKGKHDIRVG